MLSISKNLQIKNCQKFLENNGYSFSKQMDLSEKFLIETKKNSYTCMPNLNSKINNLNYKTVEENKNTK